MATCALGLGVAGCASTRDSSVRGDVYGFEDRTARVVTPRVQASTTTGDATLTPYWKADVISAATPVMSAPDAISRATEYSEVRHEAGLGTSWSLDDRETVGGSYTLSVEPDYVSHRVGLTVAREMFDDRLTLGTGATFGFDRIGTSDMPEFEATLFTLGGELSTSWVLSATLLGHVVYTFEQRSGYQANPYRYVPIFEGTMRPTSVLPESLPDTRRRHAWEGLLVASLDADTFVHAGYRFYVDDWGIVSHTARVAAWRELLGDSLRVRVRARGYTQGAASFYRLRYESPLAFRTGDYRYSPMSTVGGGLRLDLRLDELLAPETLVVTGAYDLTYFILPMYAVFSRMIANMLWVGVQLEVP